MSADRNLLLGLLALQNGFVSREDLVAAVSVWLEDKSKRLDEIFLARQALGADECQLLAALVKTHLDKHGGSAEQSLAALSSLDSAGEELARLGDSDIDATLSFVGKRGPAQSNERVHSGEGPKGGQRFRILRPHAKGGLGEVFVARDEDLNREVALKEIQVHHADNPDSRQRFVLEAEITGGLEHPGIVPVYGLGQYGDGRPYYAMRFIRGDSLKEAVDRFHETKRTAEDAEGRGVKPSASSPRPSATSAVDYQGLEFRKLLGRFIDVCQAIEYAHSRGVLHRDLKPGNIMLGKYGETLVVDWGLAKVKGRDESTTVADETTLQPASASGSAPTQMGQALGTPAFMSPEQAAGRLDELGPPADVYSLGATLYYVLTGLAPIGKDDLKETLRKVQAGEFMPPRALAPHLPRALEAICLKAMALLPEDRYHSPAALADDVEKWLADEPVAARVEPASLRARRWLRKHPKAVGSLAATLVVGIAAAIAVATVVAGKNRELGLVNQQLTDSNIAEREAKENSQAAEREARAAALAALARTCDARLAQSNILRELPDRPGVREEAKAMLTEAGGLRGKADELIQKLALDDAEAASLERAAWQTRMGDLRAEAIRWLLGYRLARTHVISLEAGKGTEKPTLSVASDGTRFAVAYPHLRKAIVYSANGKPVQDVPLPISSNSGSGVIAFSPDFTSVAVYNDASRPHTLLLVDLNGQTINSMRIPSDVTDRPEIADDDIDKSADYGTKQSVRFSEPRVRFIGLSAVEYLGVSHRLVWNLKSNEMIRTPISELIPGAESGANELVISSVRTRFKTKSSARLLNRQTGETRDLSALLMESSETSKVSGKDGEKEDCRAVGFTGDGRSMFVKTNDRLLVGFTDVEMPKTIDRIKAIDEERGCVVIHDVIPYQHGFATLERLQKVHPELYPSAGFPTDGHGTWRVALWHTGTPTVPHASLGAPHSVASSILTSDGRVIIGGRDHSLRAWLQGSVQWSAGNSSPDAIPSDDQNEELGRQVSNTYNIQLLRARRAFGDADDEVFSAPKLRRLENELQTGRFALGNATKFVQAWEFAPQGTGELQLRLTREDAAQSDSPQLVNCTAKDGKVLMSVGGAGTSSIIFVSHDGRFAVVDPKGDSNRAEPSERNETLRPKADATTDLSKQISSLELWDVSQSRSVANLGQFADDPQGISFSPDGKWLLLSSRKASQVEIWALPDATRVGVVDTPAPTSNAKAGFHFEFRVGAGHVVISRGERGVLSLLRKKEKTAVAVSPVRGFLVDLATPRNQCELAPLNLTGDELTVTARKDAILQVMQQKTGDKITPYNISICYWRRDTGTPALLGLESGPWPLGAKCALNSDGTRVAVRMGQRVELFDTFTGKQLRSTPKDAVDIPDSRLEFDSERVWLTGTPPNGSSRGVILCWRWDSAQDDKAPPIAVITSKDGTWRLAVADSGLALGVGSIQKAATLEENGAWPLNAIRDAFAKEHARILKTSRERVKDLPSMLQTAPAIAEIASNLRSLFYLGFESESDPAEYELVRAMHPTMPDNGMLRYRVALAGSSFAMQFSTASEFPGAVWSSESGRLLLAFPPGERFESLDASGKWCVTVGDEYRLTMWDTAAGKSIRTLTLPAPFRRWDKTPLRVKVHSSGERVAFLSHGTVVLWDTVENRSVYVANRSGHMAEVTSVAQHESLRLVATGGGDGSILLHDRISGAWKATLLVDSVAITSLLFLPDGSGLIAATKNGALRCCRLDGTIVWSRAGQVSPIRALAIHPHGQFLAVALETGALGYINAATGELLGAEFDDHNDVSSMSFSADGERLAMATHGGVRLWNGSDVPRMLATGAPVTGVQFLDSHGEILVTAGERIQFWRARTAEALLSIAIEDAPARSVQVTPDSSRLLYEDRSRNAVEIGLAGLLAELQKMNLGAGLHLELKDASPSSGADAWKKAMSRFNGEPTRQFAAQAKAAQDYLRDENWSMAEQAFTRTLILRTDRAADWRGRGIARLKQEKWGEAISDFSEAIRLGDNDILVRQERGIALAHAGQSLKAIDEFTSVLTSNAGYGPAWRERGKSLAKLNRNAEALADYARAIELGADDREARLARATLLNTLKKWSEVLEDCSVVLKLHPGDQDALELGIEARFELKQWPDAVEDLNQLIEISPSYSRYVDRGECLRMQKNYGAAISDFTRAIEFDAAKPRAWQLRAKARELNNDLPGAISDLTVVISMPDADKDGKHVNTRGHYYFKTGDFGNAFADFDSAVNKQPERLYIQNRAITRRRLGDLAGAVQDYTRLLTSFPDDDDLYNERGNCHFIAKEFAKARDDFSKAIEHNPSKVVYFTNRGLARRRLGEFEASIADYNQAVALDAKNANVLVERAITYATWNKRSEAASDLHAALEIDGNLHVVERQLALLQLGMGDSKGRNTTAKRMFDKFAAKGDPPTLTELVWTCTFGPFPDGIDVDQLSMLAQRQYDEQPKSQYAKVAFGALQLRLGNFVKAIEVLKVLNAEIEEQLKAGKALDASRGYGLFLLAIAEQGNGNKSQAQEWLKRADDFVAAANRGETDPTDKEWYRQLLFELLGQEAKALGTPANAKK